jgi:hypothetical protein
MTRKCRVLIENLKENLIVVPGGGINKSNLGQNLYSLSSFGYSLASVLWSISVVDPNSFFSDSYPQIIFFGF